MTEAAPGPIEVELDRLREEIATKDRIIDRLTKRVLAKDDEFAKERRSWTSKRIKLESMVKELQRSKRSPNGPASVSA